MNNESIPERHQTEWDEVSTELIAASLELNEASVRYNLAIIGRLALRHTILSEETQ